MGKPRLHIFVCVNQRPADHPKGCCADKGGEKLREQLKSECAKVDKSVRVSRAVCLGPCERGANLVIYPDNVWYCGIKASDISEIVEKHVKGGEIVKRLLNPDMHN